jgi:glyoxylase-like metal-dependent hydrolase (beta-lactamase superfamily II)/8-oxo-dGTP pyrophosphatase MutT (NUDIX family)
MAIQPRPAATLILLRPGAAGIETLMLQRTQSAAFLGGAYVFPGGSLDKTDDDSSRVIGLTEAAANARLAIPGGAMAYYVAAVRECFEEAGVLLACNKHNQMVSAERAAQLARHRDAPFLEFLRAEDLYIPAGALAYYGHWITAPGSARRFDTRFFVAVAPHGQEGTHDANETVHSLWTTPQEALERAERKEIDLVFATRHTLRDLGRFAEPEAAWAHANAMEVLANRACWAEGRDGRKLFRRADPAYFEIHWSDPEETGGSSYDLVPGVAKRLDRFVTRLIAPNPGVMTGPGTNTYLVGEEEKAVIDPGPAVDSHIEKILAFTNIKWILCTHTHMDHSPAAAAIKAATGAQVLGRAAPAGQDATFAPDRVLEHGEALQVGGISLQAIHTPGHASNHLCYLLEQTRMLFTGDHVMQGSTVVINPPDGNMRAYLASLEALLGMDIAVLAPGHGYLIGDPHREVRRLIQHRLAREKKVLRALAQLGPATVDDLLPAVYDDVPSRIHHVAARSLTAHLEKLTAEGGVRTDGPRYTLVQS